MNTPMLRQYASIKEGYPDAILFFRLGDFYEMFLDDAKVAAKELQLTLTGRGKDENRVPMCGIPYHAADQYVAKLTHRGFKVAICEQVEDPATAKGITRREVVKVITPGTTLQPECLDHTASHFLASVICHTNGKTGLAYADVSTGHFYVTAFESLLAAMGFLDRLDAKELLVPVGFSESITVPTTSFSPLPTLEAHQRLCQFWQIQALSAWGIEADHAALPAAWAIMDYVRNTQKDHPVQMTRLQRVRTEDVMAMDAATLRNLELIWPIYPDQRRNTLFWALNDTKTAMGARLLKHWIAHPLRDPDTINSRLDAVGSALSDRLTREEIRELFTQLNDIERLSTRILSEKDNPRDCIALKNTLEALRELPAIIRHLSGTQFEAFSGQLSVLFESDAPLTLLICKIRTALREDAPATTRDGGYIQAGYSADLDQLLRTFADIRDWIGSIEEIERQATGIKTLKLGFNRVFGYYLEISKTQSVNAPEHYIRKQTLANAERYITPELKDKETILLNGEEKQRQLEVSLFVALLTVVRDCVPALKTLADIIAQVDVLQSLASTAQKHNYTRPILMPQGDRVLAIENGRHPVLERHNNTFIPNTVRLDGEFCRFMLITGPNMAGKSTLMRQVALLTVMAQMGGYVPAKQMSWSPVDQLFTRIGALDNLYFGQSTFMVEMLEAANILHNATANSLIVLDEIGRGTSTFDGMSLAAAIAEHLHKTIGARTLFATHYHELTVLAQLLRGLRNYTMKITEKGGNIVFTHILEEGVADKSYGIHVAQMAGLPDTVISKASQLLTGFESEGIRYLATAVNKPQQLPLF